MTEQAVLEKITNTVDVVEHECPYEVAKESFVRRVGSHGIAQYQIRALENELVEIHQGGVCPPTHIDRGPTRVWADWVQGLQR